MHGLAPHRISSWRDASKTWLQRSLVSKFWAKLRWSKPDSTGLSWFIIIFAANGDPFARLGTCFRDGNCYNGVHVLIAVVSLEPNQSQELGKFGSAESVTIETRGVLRVLCCKSIANPGPIRISSPPKSFALQTKLKFTKQRSFFFFPPVKTSSSSFCNKEPWHKSADRFGVCLQYVMLNSKFTMQMFTRMCEICTSSIHQMLPPADKSASYRDYPALDKSLCFTVCKNWCAKTCVLYTNKNAFSIVAK